MVGWIPLISTLRHRGIVIHALCWRVQSLLDASAMEGVHSAVVALATEGMLCPKLLAIGRPLGGIAALLCCPASALVGLCGVLWATALLYQNVAGWLGAVPHVTGSRSGR